MNEQKTIESMAKIVHKAMRFDRYLDTPAWIGGNSFPEDFARETANNLLAVARAAIRNEVLEEAMQELTDSGEGQACAVIRAMKGKLSPAATK